MVKEALPVLVPGRLAEALFMGEDAVPTKMIAWACRNADSNASD
jgi:hypothetical protein